MNNNEVQLISLLNASTHGQALELKNYEKIKWEELIEEARAHHISSLIYAAIDKDIIPKYMDNSKLNYWKKEVVYSGVSQLNHMKIVSNVLKRFSDNNVPVIVLKGLVVRELYPIPQLRTMSDADVLVHKEDLPRIKEMLITTGYKQIKNEDNHGAHVVYTKGSTCIEVHWTLANEYFFKGDKSFEKNLWRDAIKVKVGGVDTLSLSLEDLAVHLCTHMAVHLAHKGFGIRQVTDLVLLVEQRGKEIIWDSFVEKVKVSGIDKFTIAIFNVCNNLFNMDIPNEIEKINTSKLKNVNELIDDIFASGVYGNRDETRVFASEFAFDPNCGATDGIGSIIKKFIKLIFPPIRDMGDKYNYAKNFFIFAPIAWSHHLIVGIFNKDYSLTKKVKMATSTVSIANKRNKLLKDLEL